MFISPLDITTTGTGVTLASEPDSLTMKMVDPVEDFEYARNAVTLTFDLSNYDRVRLRFEAMDGIPIHGIELTGEFSLLYVHLPMDDNVDSTEVCDISPAGRHQTFLDPGGNPNTGTRSIKLRRKIATFS